MTGEEIFELWRLGFAYGFQLTLLVAFVPAALSGVWSLWNIAR